MSRDRRRRRPQRIAPTVRPEPPARVGRPRAPAAPDDASLPPRERGPVGAYVRDSVDRRRWGPSLLFLPAVATGLAGAVAPTTFVGKNLIALSVMLLVVVALDVLLFGFTIVRMTRARYGREQVSIPRTLWSVFNRAYRPRRMRRPPPRV
jgi:hypothetical protein